MQMRGYKDEIYCNMLPMDVAHVLYCRPWLYVLNVTNFGKNNIYSFKYKSKNTILRPAKPKGRNGKRDISKLLEHYFVNSGFAAANLRMEKSSFSASLRRGGPSPLRRTLDIAQNFLFLVLFPTNLTKTQ